MEEDIRKQGMLFLQQQRFGKKWRRIWCVLYRESSCSISRLEFFECNKDAANAEKSDKSLRKQQEHKKVIRLSDCIRVTEVDMDGCPRDTGSFLVETTDKIYTFAAERKELEDWTHKLCETAFPMSWTDPGVKRGSLQRGTRVDEDEGMEDNSLYSGRETVRDFRVCVRRTEASDRCRLKGDTVLRADRDALHLLDKTGDILYTWPYRYLRRFGRDKSTFSFEAGRRCDSGEGNFEFDTKLGNSLFQAVEAAINLQKTSHPHRQTSGGGQAGDGVYSMVTEPPKHHKDSSTPPLHHHPPPQQQQPQRPPLTRLEPPVDKTLTGVKSLTLDTRGAPPPRKNQVKMISSCPLPHESGPSLAPGPGPPPNPRHSPKLSSTPSQDQTYSQISMPTRREKRTVVPPLITKEPEYSLPFDNLTQSPGGDVLGAPHQDRCRSGELVAADPLYDSIDEMKIRNVFHNEPKLDHIYDEPEGFANATAKAAAAAAAATAAATAAAAAACLYDDPEEMRGGAWRVMGTTADPKGHEYPYNARVDDYAVPKRAQRAFPAPQSTSEEEEEEEQGEGEEPGEEESSLEGEGPGEGEGQDSPYNNVMVKIG
ncbi:docking protein 2 isoform X2 [Mugil cephalus]|uniref:docking protein 2 isoform X2 n=1 Tax=Mugil cephalus TaxID=48193 RepID=UPI001FB79F26|nr:docking protein 2 isoform X2 [Mugil cephalus]